MEVQVPTLRPSRGRLAWLLPAASTVAALLGSDAQAASTASCTGPATVVRQWLEAWKTSNFKQMNALSEVSWRLRTSGPTETLRDQYGFKKVSSYSFVRCTSNPVSARITFRVHYRTFKASYVKVTDMVLREDRTGNPSPIGARARRSREVPRSARVSHSIVVGRRFQPRPRTARAPDRFDRRGRRRRHSRRLFSSPW
jgi:hypothetical protein